MTIDFKYIVVGRGLMGAAAARHLARQADGVAVIGPDEPDDRKAHQGVFASHYDEGRITRTIDPDRNWALLANRSIGRYGEIARDSGIDFYREAGCVVVALDRSDYLEKTRQAAVLLDVETSLLDAAGLKAAFPFFAFPDGAAGVFEARGAGHISPRKLVKAQSLLAERAGAAVICDHVVSIRSEGGSAVVETAGGRTYRGEKVLLAAGGFSIAENLLPKPVAMTVYGRTVTLFEVSETDAARLATMPSLILNVPGLHIYLLPPIRYPDGKLYLKIGGDPDDLALGDEAAMRAWFKTEGRDSVGAHLKRIVEGLVPDLVPLSISTAACVVSQTASGYPMIGYTSSPEIAVATGCAGTSAKSSDEIGRLGAELLLAGGISEQGYSTDFTPQFR
ncbi:MULTISPECIES: FAD-dependent oxidoreductase [unclassified Rhizobium]|uniref:NAD(P)/FAD-dependent oxidoreductase n=1 Tax=unclassified Rhizobium TaxID=2613769 RepID=UPI001A98E856|nr:MULTISPECIES: FAD-dependent oxidoreductase [unclassified Rhizobium]MBX5157758.1 FAD-dependent oxidoreductase [Rhizobium sp. NZLR8]MBX5164973.1 FAD-dependent oxidoreductase [Rhizobium sp. NZLR4b]MBX5184915.1 FAD-dependent oxidoreductase [Rhizobium sp. NZLR5]MBX5194950.1 FAD-dependent oxidoreductase [Rhizobium sp. NZLR10]MBX5204835.1 FAD-dependent oxidoreductase [Rhizobium sp. NZLR1]